MGQWPKKQQGRTAYKMASSQAAPLLCFNAFDRSRSSADLWGKPPSCGGKPTLYLFLGHCCCTCMCPGHLCTAVLSVTHKGTLGSTQPVEKTLTFSKLEFMWRNKSSRISFLPALSLLGFTHSDCQKVHTLPSVELKDPTRPQRQRLRSCG